MRKSTLGITGLILALAGTAYAAAPEAPRGPDANSDGTVTRTEMQARSTRIFARLDANHDGKIDRSDREARIAERMTARFDRLDGNHDGQISRAEFAAQRPMGMRQMGMGRGDPDGDRSGMMEGRGPMDMGGRGMDGHRHGMMNGRMADADRDGAVTQAEFAAAALQRFDRIDTNHDGKITREERQAARQAMHAGPRDERDRGIAPPPKGQ